MDGMNHGDMHDKEHKMMKMEWRNHMLMRMLIGLIVALFVFWLGMQLGELREAAGLDHGSMMMGGWGQMGSGRTTTMHTMMPAGTTTLTPVTTGAAAQ